MEKLKPIPNTREKHKAWPTEWYKAQELVQLGQWSPDMKRNYLDTLYRAIFSH